MSSDEDSDDGIKHLLKLNPSKLQNVTKFALFYSSVIVTLISGEFISSRQVEIHQCQIKIRVAKDQNNINATRVNHNFENLPFFHITFHFSLSL